MSIDINTTIEEMVRDLQISYIEAIVKYTDDIDGEIEKDKDSGDGEGEDDSFDQY